MNDDLWFGVDKIVCQQGICTLCMCMTLVSGYKDGGVQSYLGSNDQILHACNSGLKQQSSSSKSQGIATFCMSVILDWEDWGLSKAQVT